MQHRHTKDVKLLQIACSDKERELPPTTEAIEKMARSLDSFGQQNPIAIYHIAGGMYRLISGATRFRAAALLKWETIRASVFIGTADDIKIAELVENLDRKELTAEQRKQMKAKVKQLLREGLLSVQPGKGGRGKQEGLRARSRELGISETTARRLLRQNADSGAVSAPDKPPLTAKQLGPAAPNPPKVRSPDTPSDQIVLRKLGAPNMDWLRREARIREISIVEVVRDLIVKAREEQTQTAREKAGLVIPLFNPKRDAK